MCYAGGTKIPESALATPVPRGDFGRLYGADAADVELLIRTVAGLGARVVEVDQASRRVRLSGTVAMLCRMFGTSLEGSPLRPRTGHRPPSGNAPAA